MSGVVSLRGEPITPPGEPDSAAVDVARDVLARIESGDCNGLIVVLSYADGAVGHLIGGSQVVDNRMLGGLARAMHAMNREMDEP